ncbi:MAG: nickel-binding protein Mua [Helicobacter sp.]|uniref:nickel-binding protein Mua n=1 Tax=Helicobacter sp. TaxID=218 RepID=UPI002A91FFC8|nr:nickel-binding protein Mua [Helicobacter sp.]MDY5822851.1 nickel-binding protein Mua [Helicobacter sp.]
MSLQEDEKEVLAHIVQNIDEQEIFLEFVAKAETIKEAWQIAKIFESKKKEFVESMQEYEILIKAKEKQLKNLNAEITEANNLLKDANIELANIKTEIEDMQNKAQLYKNKLAQNKQADIESFDTQASFALAKNDDSNPLDFSGIIAEFQPLNVVSVHVKNGATAMARAAQIIYPQELHDVYLKAAKRLFRLKDKISELELKNEKLHIELRDLTEEDNFKEQMRSKINDIDDEYMSIGTPKTLSQSSNILSGMSSKTTLKETTRKETILDKNSLDEETQADRIARIDKKKERVEEMLSQLSSVLREEGVSQKSADEFLEAFKARNK